MVLSLAPVQVKMHNTAVNCLVPSRTGLVWTASAAGSVRQIGMDGARNAVEAKAPNSKSAHSTAINAAVVTNVDTLWTGARNVRVWTALGEWRQSLQTHAGKVLSMAVAGGCVWVGFSDGRLRLFEQDSAVCVVQLQDDGKHSPITCLAPTPQAMWTGTADGHVCSFGIESRRQLLEAPVFSKSGVTALAPTRNTVYIAGEKGALLALPHVRPADLAHGPSGLLRESSAEIDQVRAKARVWGSRFRVGGVGFRVGGVGCRRTLGRAREGAHATLGEAACDGVGSLLARWFPAIYMCTQSLSLARARAHTHARTRARAHTHTHMHTHVHTHTTCTRTHMHIHAHTLQ